jgi:hypothetical protein
MKHLLLSGMVSAVVVLQVMGRPAAGGDFDGRYEGQAIFSGAECDKPAAVAMTVASGRVRLPLPTESRVLFGTVGPDGLVIANGFWVGLRNRIVETHIRGEIADGVLSGHADDHRCALSIVLKKVGSQSPLSSAIRSVMGWEARFRAERTVGQAGTAAAAPALANALFAASRQGARKLPSIRSRA